MFYMRATTYAALPLCPPLQIISPGLLQEIEILRLSVSKSKYEFNSFLYGQMITQIRLHRHPFHLLVN